MTRCYKCCRNVPATGQQAAHRQVIWRYGWCMKNSQFFLFLSLSVCAVGALAQAAPPRREAAPGQPQPDVRRSELREALKKPQAQEHAPIGDSPALGSFDRRLSAQERADLREQLRQLSAEGLLNVGTK